MLIGQRPQDKVRHCQVWFEVTGGLVEWAGRSQGAPQKVPYCLILVVTPSPGK